jgi:ribosomal protein S18 acetylase RimI-like enzyme
VHPDWRRQGIGERLLLAFLDIALDRAAHEATLEVRLSNLAARRLYEKYGFRPVGVAVEMAAAIEAHAKESAWFRRRIDNAALHVLHAKEAAGLLVCPD